jgi:hypothetical protein
MVVGLTHNDRQSVEQAAPWCSDYFKRAVRQSSWSKRRNTLGESPRYADEQGVADHMTQEQAAEWVLDCFKPAVRQELEMVGLQGDNLAG